jgi:uridine phosphorylase
VWRQIIEDCQPKWVITTGTAGAIGAADEVGDVVVARFVTFGRRTSSSPTAPQPGFSRLISSALTTAMTLTSSREEVAP